MAQSNDTVIIAIDDSTYSEGAFNWYFQHMHRTGNRVILVHCLELPAMPSRDTWEQQTREGKGKGKEVEAKFTALLAQHKVAPEFITEFEKPGEFIVSTSKKEKSDVIVMGTRGMGKLKRVFLGSVSNYVLNHANCPVLVVRPPHDDE